MTDQTPEPPIELLAEIRDYDEATQSAKLWLFVRSTRDRPVDYFIVTLYVEEGIRIEWPGGATKRGTQFMTVGDGDYEASFDWRQIDWQDRVPLFREAGQQPILLGDPLGVKFPNDRASFISWQIAAPGVPHGRGVYRFKPRLGTLSSIEDVPIEQVLNQANRGRVEKT